MLTSVAFMCSIKLLVPFNSMHNVLHVKSYDSFVLGYLVFLDFVSGLCDYIWIIDIMDFVLLLLELFTCFVTVPLFWNVAVTGLVNLPVV